MSFLDQLTAGIPTDFELTPEAIKSLGLRPDELRRCIINPMTRQPATLRSVHYWLRGERTPKGWARRSLLTLFTLKWAGRPVQSVPKPKRRRSPAELKPSRIRNILERLGWSPEQAAELTGIPAAAWAGWCDGTRRPDRAAVLVLKILEHHAGITRRYPIPGLDPRTRERRPSPTRAPMALESPETSLEPEGEESARTN